MSKMLPKTTLYDRIHNDLDYMNTFDLPQLRYHGQRIQVFLWDDLQDYPMLSSTLNGCSAVDDYRVESAYVHTVKHFLPWYNMSHGNYHANSYCLYSQADLNDIEMPEWMLEEPMPLSGTLFSMSLKGLVELDRYYENEYKYTRRIVRVQPQSKTKYEYPEIDVFGYFNEIEDVANYSTHSKRWSLQEGMDLLPFRELGGAYEM